MFVFLNILMNIVLLVFIGVGCKKEKNNASKLKPRDMSKEKPVPSSPDTNQKPAEASPAPDEKKPEAAAPAPSIMPERAANDNETIEEAPSKWAPVKE
uniref:Uncharacterized protein n=1 Tax=Caenorhabditis tropicalis TaxID=1561998 RepID=A0A1I7V072_9PELO